MIAATNLIFPSPKHNRASTLYFSHIRNEIVYIPKTRTMRCREDKEDMVSTARSRCIPHKKPITIQPSHEFKTKVRHRRSVTHSLIFFDPTHRQQLSQRFLESEIRSQHNFFKVKSQRLSYQPRNKQTCDGKHRNEVMRGVARHRQGSKLGPIENNDLVEIQEAKKPLQARWEEYRKPCRDSIPCLWLCSKHNPDHMIVYYHGNAQDITICHSFLRSIVEICKISLLAVEYPGYAMYEGETAVNSIEADCTVLLQHLIAMGYCMSNVFVMGRSIGTGPAICLAGLYSFGGLTLLSPFLSVCRLVKEVYGLLAGALLKEPFDNEQRVENINCPCLIVHGLQDKLINYEHALSLGSKFKGGCKVQLVEAMTHSVFRIQHFGEAVRLFMEETGFCR